MPQPQRSLPSFFLTIDVAHPPLSADQVEQALLDSLSKVRNSDALRAIKIIHGYGSSGKGGSTKEVVRNWVYRHATRRRAVIEGETYDIFHADVMEMRKQMGDFDDPDLQNTNRGITILWVK